MLTSYVPIKDGCLKLSSMSASSNMRTAVGTTAVNVCYTWQQITCTPDIGMAADTFFVFYPCSKVCLWCAEGSELAS